MSSICENFWELNVYGVVGDNVFESLQSVLHRNEGHSIIWKISGILNGEKVTANKSEPELVVIIWSV